MQLLELKKEFERCRKDIARYHLLIDQREQDLQEIDSLKASVEAELIQMHQLMKKSGQDVHSLQKKINADTERIAVIKKALKQIDHELDEIGEDKEAQFEKIKNELISQIQEQFPETAQEYQKIERDLKEARQNKGWLLAQNQQIQPLFYAFQTVASIKLRGNFFDFLRGRNPKSLFARSLHHAYELAQKIYAAIDDEQFRKFLDKFLYEAKNSWDKDVRTEKFPALFEEFSNLMADQEQNIQEEQHKVAGLEATLDTWILQYSSR